MFGRGISMGVISRGKSTAGRSTYEGWKRQAAV